MQVTPSICVGSPLPNSSCTARNHLGSHSRGWRTYSSFRHSCHLDVNIRQCCGTYRILISPLTLVCPPSKSPRMCHESKSQRRLRRRASSTPTKLRSQYNLSPPTPCRCLLQAWLASRVLPYRRGAYLVPGAHRPVNESNIRLAITISRACVIDLVKTLWGLHPIRTTLMMALHIVRAFFPAFRGYSQAMIVDEVCFFSRTQPYIDNSYPVM